ncbi:MAG: HTH domain-containing protein, partial [Clostridia bacterium]|nr:HTH domain-containing protein [Clostridia bacterium]
MKTERMIGILAILQTQGRVTCPFLAEKFEVSVRTIRRDIDEISKAGIPLVTTQGNGGGVALMEGY